MGKYRLWRKHYQKGYHQLNGEKDVVLPYGRCLLEMPRRRLSLKQKQCIIDWIYGRPVQKTQINSF